MGSCSLPFTEKAGERVPERCLLNNNYTTTILQPYYNYACILQKSPDLWRTSLGDRDKGETDPFNR